MPAKGVNLCEMSYSLQLCPAGYWFCVCFPGLKAALNNRVKGIFKGLTWPDLGFRFLRDDLYNLWLHGLFPDMEAETLGNGARVLHFNMFPRNLLIGLTWCLGH